MKRRTLVFTIIGLAGAVCSFAQTPSDKPVVRTEIESVHLDVQNDGENSYFLFVESVILTATNMRLECDQLEIFVNREAETEGEIGQFSAFNQILATGNVRIVQAERIATCDKAVVEPNQERIVLTGNPVVEQAGGRIEGQEIILNRSNGRITIDGSNQRRVRLIAPPIADLGFEEKAPVPVAEKVTTMEDKLLEEAATESVDADKDLETKETTEGDTSE